MKYAPNPRNRQSGQAIVMVTLALLAMCGVMGLAVDLGWSYFDRKAEQAAADAAALSAARAALSSGVCGAATNMNCSLASNANFTDCAAIGAGPLQIGCNYAQYNGFQPNGNNNRQTVLIASDAKPVLPPPADPSQRYPNEKCCVQNYEFWVSVKISETIPQLFSAVLGNNTSTVAVRATAILANVIVPGAFVFNNRSGDPSPVIGQGTDLCVEENTKPSVTDPGANLCNSGNWGNGGKAQGITLQNVGGVSLASDAQGGPYAGYTYDGSGKVDIFSSSTQVLRGSTTSVNIASSWNTTFSYPSSNPLFDDPMRGKGQPPITTTNLANPSIPGTTAAGGLSGPLVGSLDPANPTILPPANYWVQAPCSGSCGSPVSSGAPVTLTCPTGSGAKCYFSFQNPSNYNSFSDYIIYGGLHIANNGSDGVPVVNFGPGRYTFAGTATNNALATGVNPSFQMDWGAFAVDHTTVTAAGGLANLTANSVRGSPTAATDAGVSMIFTDTNYPGLSTNLPAAVQACNCLQYGTSGLYMPDPANNSNMDTVYSFHGINPANGPPAELDPFQGILWWQDQGNSYVKYTSSGFVDSSCGGGLDSPCMNSVPGGSISKYSPQMDFRLGETPGGSAKFIDGLYGALYQPRGGWGVMVAYGDQTTAVPLQVFSGALGVDGRGLIKFNNPTVPAVMLTAALIE